MIVAYLFTRVAGAEAIALRVSVSNWTYMQAECIMQAIKAYCLDKEPTKE